MPENILDDIEPYIDFDKCIKSQRLKYSLNAGYVFSIVLSFLFSLFYIFIVSIPLLALIGGTNVPLWLILCSVVLILWMLANMILNNAFVRINGNNDTKNRENLQKVLASFYEDLDIQINNEKMMRSYKPTGRPIWGRMVTIVFDNNIMLLNITKLGKTNTPTFIHGFFNYLKAKKIKKNYELFFS